MNTTTLAQTAAITPRQIDHWVKARYLHPWGGVGTGNAREFPTREVRVAILMGRLTRAGLRPEAAHNAARLVVAGQRVMLAPGIELVLDAPTPSSSPAARTGADS